MFTINFPYYGFTEIRDSMDNRASSRYTQLYDDLHKSQSVTREEKITYFINNNVFEVGLLYDKERGKVYRADSLEDYRKCKFEHQENPKLFFTDVHVNGSYDLEVIADCFNIREKLDHSFLMKQHDYQHHLPTVPNRKKYVNVKLSELKSDKKELEQSLNPSDRKTDLKPYSYRELQKLVKAHGLKSYYETGRDWNSILYPSNKNLLSYNELFRLIKTDFVNSYYELTDVRQLITLYFKGVILGKMIELLKKEKQRLERGEDITKLESEITNITEVMEEELESENRTLKSVISMIHYLDKNGIWKRNKLHQDQTKQSEILSFVTGYSVNTIRRLLVDIDNNRLDFYEKNLPNIEPLMNLFKDKN